MRTWKVCAPVFAATALAGCFATQSDVRVLQGDLELVRNESARADSVNRAKLDHILATMGNLNESVKIMSDSMATLNARMFRFRSDMSTSMTSVEQQLLQIQELTGQSQRRLQDLRASMEERQEAQQTSTAPAAGGAPAGAADATPGPSQLFQAARGQMVQGSNAAARSAFQDLLTKYPQSDLAPEAQLSIATTYEAEGDTTSADSVYAYTAAKYPKSRSAATAVYKRAVLAQKAGKTEDARKLFQTVIKKYPNSDEAALSRDLLSTLSK